MYPDIDTFDADLRWAVMGAVFVLVGITLLLVALVTPAGALACAALATSYALVHAFAIARRWHRLLPRRD